MTSPILAVAFDAVGTLIRPEPCAAEVYAMIGARHGSRLTRDEVRRRFEAAFRRQEELDFNAGLVTSEERERRRWREIVAEVLDDVGDPEACLAQLYEHFRKPEAWACDADAEELIGRLRAAGYLVALASNFDRRLHDLVAGSGPLRGITHVVVSSEVGWRKPAAAFFEALTAALGVPAGAVLVVGDDPVNDYQGALAVGMRAVLVDPGGRHGEAGVRRLAGVGRLLGLPRKRAGGGWEEGSV